ncbi:transient receptor potential cation channel trpm-like [Limulus polyphemus]|uniref:Transient receptor potential cation channel trpm-like n=1 Tax=Limulus polyphemus TaxID=6850 RepID=A0ABM1SWZ2_LIMPO|nr:transient receptor potential cation channel trpm-like [Limulus polyphemus]
METASTKTQFAIETKFQKRECCKFIASSKDQIRCCCGLAFEQHSPLATQGLGGFSIHSGSSQFSGDEHWSFSRHTALYPTDAFGIIEFQGSSHPLKAQYVRLSYDTRPELVLQLLTEEWKLELPKLLISVHGGKANFELQHKLKQVLRKGLVKAAKTTGAWIFTAGTNTGVMRHVGEALLNERTPRQRRVVTIGIAPWGIIENKRDLVGKNTVVPYHSISSPKSRLTVLNNHHSYFLLVDNGTVGKYGAEIAFRKKLEKYISKQKIQPRSDIRSCGVPVVCIVVEGGLNTIRTVLECVTDTPPVPVVICDGSGRAADLLAFTHKYVQESDVAGAEHLVSTIENTFHLEKEKAEKLYGEMVECVRRRDLITVFRKGEGPYQDLDQAVLTALLKGHHLPPPDQLNLALTWNRVDIARSEIFLYGQEWTPESLETAMMEALLLDRVDFVKLLLENGVSMQKFLTIKRLEDIYNTKCGPGNTLQYLVRDVRKNMPHGYRYTLYDIGLVIEKLMGGAYRSSYCRKKFRQFYNNVMKRIAFNDRMKRVATTNSKPHRCSTEFLLYLICRDFETRALELLDYCYRQDDDIILQLLTYELQNWSKQTCLSLAVNAKHCGFVAHTASQMLLADLWMGGLRTRRNINLKVILGILMPLSILALEFKSKEELQLMPQTEEEHILDLKDDEDSTSDSDSETHSQMSHVESFTATTLTRCKSTGQLNQVENGIIFTIDNQGVDLDNLIPRIKKSPLRLGKKVYEFYAAPVTKFWGHTMAYGVFMCFYTYVVLVKMRASPSWQEIYVIAYLCTLGLEKIREIMCSEPVKLVHKISVWIDNRWNACDLVAILFFLLGMSLRFHVDTQEEGRVIYCVDIIYWYLRSLDFFSVNKYLGPFVTMIGKMVSNMIYFCVLLLVVLMSYGVARQSILYPDEESSWQLARNIFHMPYWMLYGEVYADEIDPVCHDDEICPTGKWLNPAIMAVYLLIANILLVNLLIAVFNNIFMEVNAMAQEVWKYNRFRVVMEYEQKPVLPPPLIIFSHLHLLVKYISSHKSLNFDHGLKLFLDEDDVEKIHDFEEECVEGFFREKEKKYRLSVEQQVQTTSDKAEIIGQRVEDINQREKDSSCTLQNLEYRLNKLEELAEQTSTSLSVIHRFMSTRVSEMTYQTQSSRGTSSEDLNSLVRSVSTVLDAEELRRVRKYTTSSSNSQKDSNLSKVSFADSEEHSTGHSLISPLADLNKSSCNSVLQNQLRRRRLENAGLYRQISVTSPEFPVEQLEDNIIAQLKEKPDEPISTKSQETSKTEPVLQWDPQICVIPSSPLPNLVSRKGEYTSITDDLENKFLFPPQSPTPGTHISPSQSLKNCQNQHNILALELEVLHDAEETDYNLMEGLIQRRLRRDSENLTVSLEDLCSNVSDTSSSSEELSKEGLHMKRQGTSAPAKLTSLKEQPATEDQGEIHNRFPHSNLMNTNETKF